MQLGVVSERFIYFAVSYSMRGIGGTYGRQACVRPNTSKRAVSNNVGDVFGKRRNPTCVNKQTPVRKTLSVQPMSAAGGKSLPWFSANVFSTQELRREGSREDKYPAHTVAGFVCHKL